VPQGAILGGLALPILVAVVVMQAPSNNRLEDDAIVPALRTSARAPQPERWASREWNVRFRSDAAAASSFPERLGV
jgi:hypothetical protein